MMKQKENKNLNEKHNQNLRLFFYNNKEKADKQNRFLRFKEIKQKINKNVIMKLLELLLNYLNNEKN